MSSSPSIVAPRNRSRSFRSDPSCELGSEALGGASLFTEPDGYYKPQEPPTTAEYILLDGRSLTLSLVGESPLWGHMLWNASQATARYLQEHALSLVEGKDILELGAGAGLPGIVCGIEGAKRVVITDYPDELLIENIRQNIYEHRGLFVRESEVLAEGYLWGSSAPSSFFTASRRLEDDDGSVSSDSGDLNKTHARPSFDLLILSDLLFNHSEHAKLLQTLRTFLRRPSSCAPLPALCSGSSPRALIFFTPHRPHLMSKDLTFLDLVRAGGDMRVEKVLERDMGAVMFEDDKAKDMKEGDEKLRRMVYGWEVSWMT